jgi:DNA-binding transcriptional regulator YdaS (Cro superfamily)
LEEYIVRKIIITALAILVGSTVPSVAQTYRSEARESRQEYRIYRGAARGELTPQELRQIERQQRRIDRSQVRATRDGYISPKERRRIERQQDRASRNIYRKNNNGRYID